VIGYTMATMRIGRILMTFILQRDSTITRDQWVDYYLIYKYSLCFQEWLWVVGYFLRAKLVIAKKLGGKEHMAEAMASCNKMLASHTAILRDSAWKGLPELTNAHGAPCQDSCPVQAWSMATMLDVLYDLDVYKAIV